MRCGIEKTNETSESLIENEEKWLNRQLNMGKYSSLSMDDLRSMPTVLSLRNDLVLPRYHQQPQTLEKEGNKLEFIFGFIIGFLLTAVLLLFYIFWDSRLSNYSTQMSRLKKNGVYSGALANFLCLYIIMFINY